MSELPCIIFIASLPPIQSAISLDGHGDGGRVKLDVPASDAGALLLLQHNYTGKAFRVTIEAVESTSTNGGQERVGR